ncbi:unnamed protein product [Diamesa tonsa]
MYAAMVNKVTKIILDAKLLQLAWKELKFWNWFPRIKTKSTTITSPKEEFEDESIATKFLAQLGYLLLTIIGYIILIFLPPRINTEKHRKGYVPLFKRFEKISTVYFGRKLSDCFYRPICSVPSATVFVHDRVSKDKNKTFQYTGTETEYLNLASYNYLGFAQKDGPCAEEAIKAIRQYGVSSCSSRRVLGTNPLHIELEQVTARFLGVDDAMVFGMGFATNTMNLPALISHGCLVVSDEKNHSSIVLGIRLSGAVFKIYKHNNMKSLENILETAIIEGQPSTQLPWKKIFVLFEGVFSMDGSIAKLPEIIELKRKYKFYIYLDEAHSIGAVGDHGRGVVELFGINPKDIDILMGTFTKSFGSAGGYIAGSKTLINYLKVNSHDNCYGSSMSPPIAQQILTSMKIIMGLDGSNDGEERIQTLARNTKYFRRNLAKFGIIIYGNEKSPVVPMMVYNISKMGMMSERKIAVVGAVNPVTDVYKARLRFCISSKHTKEQLDYALSAIKEISITIGLNYSRLPIDSTSVEY